MKTNRQVGLVIAIVIASLGLASCHYAEMPKSASGTDVTIDISIDRMSAGFVEVTFNPDKNAFYVAAVDKVKSGIDLEESAQPFMDLALDSCYVKYVEWRHSHLAEMEEDVADFPSHSLNYGKTTILKNYLDPDTDYWVYCFVVDANSNKANGKLYWTQIHTQPESVFWHVRFSYRVKGEWDYVYPYDKQSGELVTFVPWVGKTVDSLEIRRLGYASPGKYFDAEFRNYDEDNGYVFTGIYAHQNNGVGDGTSKTLFEEGHTYYTAMATFDGPRNDCFDIYRFTWDGPETELLMNDDDSTQGAW